MVERDGPRMIRSLICFAGLLAGIGLMTGCGSDTGLVLTIESSYSVPDEIDHLSIEVIGGNEPAASYQLGLTAPFPHQMAIATEDVTGTLRVTIEAMKGTDTVTTTNVSVELVQGRVQEYFVSL